MNISIDYLLVTAAVSLLVSLVLAWLASFIIYGKVAVLKRVFPATHQLIRAHIDYLLMSILLVVCFYLIERLSLEIPNSIILVTCFGALYNPFGFIVIAVKPELASPKTRIEKLRVMFGFLPATIGYGFIMIQVLRALLQ